MNTALESTVNQMFDMMWVGERNYNLDDDEPEVDFELQDFNDRQLDLFKQK